MPATLRLATAAKPPDPSPLLLAPRALTERITGAPNAHRYWRRARNDIEGPVLGPLRIMATYALLAACKHLPFLELKNGILRLLGMKIGRNVTIASGVSLDYFFPDLIEIEDNAIIGMNVMILTHEYLHDRVRTGGVRIGADALVGARSTVMAGVSLAPGSVVSAMSLVNKSVSAPALVGGNPMRVIKCKEGSTWAPPLSA